MPPTARPDGSGINGCWPIELAAGRIGRINRPIEYLFYNLGAADGAGGVGGVPPLPSLRHTPSKIPEMQGIIGEAGLST